jgi:hypothetical protein
MGDVEGWLFTADEIAVITKSLEAIGLPAECTQQTLPATADWCPIDLCGDIWQHRLPAGFHCPIALEGYFGPETEIVPGSVPASTWDPVILEVPSGAPMTEILDAAQSVMRERQAVPRHHVKKE